jgi:hypothetical protein
MENNGRSNAEIEMCIKNRLGSLIKNGMIICIYKLSIIIINLCVILYLI